MVEIKRTSGQSFRQRRIGVVNVDTGASRAARETANTFRGVADAMYKEAVSQQKESGKKFGKNAVTVDPATGNIKIQKLPQNLGAFGQAEAGVEIERQYSIMAQNDLRAGIKLISEQSGGDEAKFEQLYTEFKDKRRKAIVDSGGAEYAQQFDKIATQMGAAARVDIQLENLKQANNLAITNHFEDTRNNTADMVTLLSAGEVEAGEQLRNQIKQSNTENTLLSPVQRAQANSEIDRQYHISGVKGSLGEEVSSNEVLSLTIEASRKSWSEETLQKFPGLKKHANLTSVQWDSVESDLRSLQGSLAKRESQARQMQNAVQGIASGTANKTEKEMVAEQLGVSMQGIVTQGFNAPQMDKYIEAANELPLSVAGYLSRGIGGTLPQDDLPLVLDLVKTAETHRTRSTPEGTFSRGLGLSDADQLKLDYISNYISINGDQSIGEAINTANVIREDKDLREKLINIYGVDSNKEVKSGDGNFVIASKLLKKKRGSLPASVRDETMPVFLQALQMSETSTEALGLYDDWMDKTYTSSSKYMLEGEVTRYSPEQVYADNFKVPEVFEKRSEYNPFYKGQSGFERAVNNLLESGGYADKEIGKDVFFRVDKRRTDSSRAVYFVVDAFGMPLYKEGEPLVYDTDRQKNIVLQGKMMQEAEDNKAIRDGKTTREELIELQKINSELQTLRGIFATGM